jgi:hypothetical protein
LLILNSERRREGSLLTDRQTTPLFRPLSAVPIYKEQKTETLPENLKD